MSLVTEQPKPFEESSQKIGAATNVNVVVD